MDKADADILSLGTKTCCPICAATVSKPTMRSDSDRSRSIVCENEYYVHYVDRNGNNILQQYLSPRNTPDHIRFKQ